MHGTRRCLLDILVVVSLSFTLAQDVNAEPVEPIRWRTGPVAAAPKDSAEAAKMIGAVAAMPGVSHLVVQFSDPVDPPERAVLAAAGLELLSYLGADAFFAAVSADGVDQEALAQFESLIDAKLISRSWKLHPFLATGPLPSWAVVSVPEPGRDDQAIRIGLYALFHADIPLRPDGVTIVRQHNGRIRSLLEGVNGMVIELPLENLHALADEDAVQWIEPPLPRMEHLNNSVRAITEADIVQAPPYDLDGSGVTVLVYDGGTARASHVDFSGRLTVRDDTWMDDHPTHVSCTIGGDGTATEGEFRGMAPGVTLKSYGFQYDGSGIFLYTNPGDIEDDYDEAINVHGADIANNSIGTNTCWNGFPCEITGDYGVTSALIDAIVAGSLGEPFRVVWANGNERNCPGCPGEHQDGYHSTAPPACAKNIISVGALNSNNDTQTSFTSWGPTDDGRLKPDVAAPGCQSNGDLGVTSCSAMSNTAYVVGCGTSMAAPTVTGLAALLLEDYRALFPTADDFRNSTLKALLAHTAADLAPAGPDYKAGFGSVRVQRAVDFMRSDNGLNFFEASVDHQESYTAMVRVLQGDAQLKVTLAWDDAPGTPNVEPALVNDLDLRVYDAGRALYYPWTLDPQDPSAPAVQTHADHVNNIEQVVVDAPQEGLWLVEVLGFNVPQGSQSFSLCASPRLVYDCDENGVPDDEQIQADPSLDCSGNGVLDECEPDCDGDGIADSCEIFSGTSGDCNANAVPDDCEPDDDCNANGVQDICDVAAGTGTDCNHNVVLDECEIADGTSEDCNANGLPDECEPDDDCNENGIADICDIGSGTSEDCNENGKPDECDLFDCGPPIGSCPRAGDCCAPHGNPGCICARCCYSVCQDDPYCCEIEWDFICAYWALLDPECNCDGGPSTYSPDCNDNDVPDECDIADGTSGDCNSNEIPDECDPNFDCNSNGIQDICDVAAETSEDCNFNEVPDECEPDVDCNQNGVQDICDVTAGTSSDCNANEVPDECDVADGTSEDCNTNAVPDECEPPDDCNENGVQDICDVAAGTSDDCNVNEVPDECEIYDCGSPGGLCSGTGDCCQPGGNGTPACDCFRCCVAVCSIYPPCCSMWDTVCALFASSVPDCDCGAPGQDWEHDCNETGTLDGCDLSEGTSEDCNANAVPDECDPDFDCNQNGVQDICDVAAGTSEDCNGNEVPDECDEDCNDNGSPDECDIADGVSEDCDGSGVPDECDAYDDCNENGVQDICDLAIGASEDCNRNGVPDECEADCNDNGVPDDCDLTSADPYPVDDCADANRACPGPSYLGSTSNASNDGASSCGLSEYSRDEWYYYRAPNDGMLTVSLCESSYDTVVSVHSGCPGTIDNELACNDDYCGLRSRVSLPVSAGEQYWIRIGGFYLETGSFGMTLTGPGDASDCEATSSDCNSNTVPDECDVGGGTSQDCQLDGVPDECQVPPIAPGAPDCDENGVPDECDTDCQPNGVPDACDIDSEVSTDCNDNLIPDECDLASAASEDCNGNNRPDECDIFGCGEPIGVCPGSGDCCDPSGNGTAGCDCAGCCHEICAFMPSCCEQSWDVICAVIATLASQCDCGGQEQDWSYDCNENDVPDECDIANGVSEDCNTSGIPDTCEPDSDGDSAIDDCDGCPQDLYKTAPGQCGCGQVDVDTDGDGQADCVDADDDNDGVADGSDTDPLDASVCEDMDGDGCDDCAIGADGYGPLADNDPANDGTDYNGDGICDDDAIPASSVWGLAIMTLLALVGAKLCFGRRGARHQRHGMFGA